MEIRKRNNHAAQPIRNRAQPFRPTPNTRHRAFRQIAASVRVFFGHLGRLAAARDRHAHPVFQSFIGFQPLQRFRMFVRNHQNPDPALQGSGQCERVQQSLHRQFRD